MNKNRLCERSEAIFVLREEIASGDALAMTVRFALAMTVRFALAMTVRFALAMTVRFALAMTLLFCRLMTVLWVKNNPRSAMELWRKPVP